MIDNRMRPPAETDDLARENRSLRRQVRDLESQLKRNKAMLDGRNSVNTLLASQQLKIEKNMTLLLENSPDIILLFDQAGRFSYCTNTFLAATGIQGPGLVSGRHFAQVFAAFAAPAWLDKLEACYSQALAEKRTVVMDDELDFSGRGQPRSYSIQITPMLGKAGVAEGAMMLFHDLTDMVRAIQAAERANSAKSRFLATMSHEMRTPLNAITGMTHIARMSDRPEQKERALAQIEAASDHLLGVISDILDMSKIDAGKLELSDTVFEVESMLSGATGVVAHSVAQKEQRFSQYIDPAIPPHLLGDEQRLRQVVTNLLSNAVKFTPQGGSITLEVRLGALETDSCRLDFSVIDTGIGISEDQQAVLFRSFAQADSSVSRRFGGTGLGLVISKSIVEMMGGAIGVRSEPDKGSCFFFSVRLGMARDAAQLAPRDAAGDAIADCASRFIGRRILLAEDVSINREIVLTLLEPTGVSIDSAVNGREAVELFFRNGGGYDLILMDIHMPEVDGYEATRLIREGSLSAGRTVPIVAMTANVFKEDVDRCLAAGMNGHLSKPLVIEDMMTLLAGYLLNE